MKTTNFSTVILGLVWIINCVLFCTALWGTVYVNYNVYTICEVSYGRPGKGGKKYGDNF